MNLYRSNRRQRATRRSWFSSWTPGWYRPRKRALAAETLEQRRLLAGDVISRMAFLVDGTHMPDAASEQPLFAPQALPPAAGEKVRIRLEAQSLDEVPITSIQPGNEFVLRAYVSDLRAEPLGVFGAYVDVTYSTDFVSAQAGAGDGVVNEAPYTNGSSGTAQTQGLIDEAGGFSGNSTGSGAAEALLFTVLMKADAAGVVTFTLDPADDELHEVLLYGDDTAIPFEEVEFVNSTLTIGAPQPTLSISDATVTETDDQVAIAEFTVTLSSASTEPVLVDYATSDGTATAGADYEATTAGSLIFAPGVTTQTISIPVLADNATEANETFNVTLTNPSGATLADAVGVGTIIDDDAPPATLSVTGGSVAEGNSGTTELSFEVRLSSAVGEQVTVDYATVPGTATAGTDYQSATGTVTFAAGETVKTVNVLVNGDTDIEEAETFSLVLSNSSGPEISVNSATGTITNDDAVGPTISIADATIVEGNDGFKDMLFTVTLSAAQTTTTTVNFSTADGTAVAGTDYEAKTGTVTIAPGTTTQSIVVRVIGDVLDEADETFLVNLTSVSGATIVDGQATGTITDDDDPALPKLTVSDPTPITEGNTGTTALQFTVTLTPASDSEVTVGYNTSDGTATAGSDFEATNGTLTFAPGETTKTVTVNIVGDTDFEQDETFTLKLANPTGATITDGSAQATITNDDDLGPAFSVNDIEVAEGDSGTTNATFTITLSEALTTTATVNYATASGTALSSGDGADFTAVSGTLTFAPGETTKTVVVAVNGDALDEDDETFRLVLSGATGAAIADAEGTATIVDGDASPTITILNRTVEELDTGVRGMVFTVQLSAASGRTVTVKYATADGTATAGEDYNALNGTLTFAPGVTERTFNVTVLNDTKDEANEKFTVTLSEPTNATIADGTADGTITDNDPEPSISIADASVTEGDDGTTTLTFTVSLSAVSGLPVVVDYTTVAGTALAGSDFTTTSGTLTFNPGEGSKTISVPIVNDLIGESTETFTVKLSNATFASISDDTATGTITDNDAQTTISIGNATVVEGDSGTQNLVFTVTLSEAATSALTVQFATANGTATAGSDYTATNGTLTFAVGETTKTITVPVIGDGFAEEDETVLVNLTNPSLGVIGTAQGTGTITNDDSGPVEGEAASVSGRVYLDVNQNGVHDAGELPLANITVRLTGTDRVGRAVDLITTTNEAGDYFFANLVPGQYTLTETHPTQYLDGIDTVGSLGGTTAADQFFFTLGAAQNGTGYNFGETGFTLSSISRRNFIVG